jgi:prepilin-type N-terminal cleavage/methylation domain-containing protein
MELALPGAMKVQLRAERNRGFTMIELLVVIAIIAVLLAVAIPAMTNFLRVYQIRGADSMVASTLQAARLKAITRNVNLGTVFVVTGVNTFQWAMEDDLGVHVGATADTICTTAWSSVPTECGGGTGGFPKLLTDHIQNPLNTNLVSQANPPQTLPLGMVFADPTAVCNVAGSTANEWGIRFNRLGSGCGVNVGCNRWGGTAPASPTVNRIYVNPASGNAVICVQEPANKLFGTITFSGGGRTVTAP